MVRNEGELEYPGGWEERGAGALHPTQCGEVPCMDAGS